MNDINLDNFWFNVKWQPRPNKILPLDSVLRYQTIANYDPKILLKFWELAFIKNNIP